PQDAFGPLPSEVSPKLLVRTPPRDTAVDRDARLLFVVLSPVDSDAIPLCSVPRPLDSDATLALVVLTPVDSELTRLCVELS
ncbi:hypothetical protein AAHH78_37240, partial [Burkholderia pseudomallei]